MQESVLLDADRSFDKSMLANNFAVPLEMERNMHQKKQIRIRLPKKMDVNLPGVPMYNRHPVYSADVIGFLQCNRETGTNCQTMEAIWCRMVENHRIQPIPIPNRRNHPPSQLYPNNSKSLQAIPLRFPLQVILEEQCKNTPKCRRRSKSAPNEKE